MFTKPATARPARTEIQRKPGGQAGSTPTGPGDSCLVIREKSPILFLYKTENSYYVLLENKNVYFGGIKSPCGRAQP